MKFAQIFGLVFIALMCVSVTCDAKRREKRTLGTILQFFGFQIVPLNQNQSAQGLPGLGRFQFQGLNPNRIRTVMPTERPETTTEMRSVMEIISSSTPETPLSTQAPIVPAFIPMQPIMPLRIIIGETDSVQMRSQSTLPASSIIAPETSTMSPMVSAISPSSAPLMVSPPVEQIAPTLQQTMPPAVQIAQQTMLPVMSAAQQQVPPAILAVQQTMTPATITAPIEAQPTMPIVNSLNGSPLPQLMAGMPFRIVMDDTMTGPSGSEPAPYPVNVPSSTLATPLDVRSNLMAPTAPQESLKPTENIQVLPLASSGSDQQFASQMALEKFQERFQEKNIQVLKSNEVTSSFFGQQTFPPAFNIFPQHFLPPQDYPQDDFDRRDFSSPQSDFASSQSAPDFNGQYFNYFTLHR